VVFKFYTGGTMGNDRAVLNKIKIGQLQGGAVTAVVWQTFIKMPKFMQCLCCLKALPKSIMCAKNLTLCFLKV
jgi:hypothetical protein